MLDCECQTAEVQPELESAKSLQSISDEVIWGLYQGMEVEVASYCYPERTLFGMRDDAADLKMVDDEGLKRMVS